MEQIRIIFFVLTSFFGIEDGSIAADKTYVTVNPENKEIEIVQNGLFTVLQKENDGHLVMEQWGEILEIQENENTSWATELANFPTKRFHFTLRNDTIRPHLLLTYATEDDLQALGVWYDSKRNQFSVNNIPHHNLKTKSGKLTGNYWNFKGDGSFSFTLEPFLEMPVYDQQIKIRLEELLKEYKKE